MPTHIGLLRAVNLAGLNRVSMGELRDLLAKLGMTDPRTLLQSGNVVFRSDVSSTTELEDLLQEATAKTLGVKTDYFVRTAKDWKAAVAANPFPKEAKADPGHLLVMFLKASPRRDAVAALQKAIKGREVVKAEGRQAYLVYPDGVGRSRLTTALIEQKLGTRGTARNWNTVMKLAALAETST